MSENENSKAEESEEEVKAEAAEAAEAPESVEAAEEKQEEVEAPQAVEESDEKEEAVEEQKEEAPQEEAVAESKEEEAPEAKEETAAAEEAAPEEGDSADAASTPDLVKKAEEKLKELEKDEEEELIEKVVFINRCAKVVKGGRRFSFSALVVCGDQKGNVGYGFGKANEVADCIRKGSEMSKRSMVPVSLQDNTIPHEVIGEFGGGRVLLRPASPGTGIIAGGGVRAVVEAAGIKDVLAKSLGSNNHANVVKATLQALTSLRTKEQIYKLRGKKLKEKAAL